MTAADEMRELSGAADLASSGQVSYRLRADELERIATALRSAADAQERAEEMREALRGLVGAPPPDTHEHSIERIAAWGRARRVLEET